MSVVWKSTILKSHHLQSQVPIFPFFPVTDFSVTPGFKEKDKEMLDIDLLRKMLNPDLQTPAKTTPLSSHLCLVTSGI